MIKVVLIEDEEYLRKEIALTTPWQDLGCTLIGEASNGQDGLKLIQKAHPQIIITDIRMPGMDGLTMLENLENTQGQRSPSVLILTGHSDFDYARQALRLGVKEYLLKPIDDDEFYTIIRKLAQEQDRLDHQIISRQRIEMLEGTALAEFREYEAPHFGSSQDEYIRLSIEYIQQHYVDDIALGDAAENLGITQSYLSRLFKSHTSYTFLEYLTCYRLRQAVKLLDDRSLKINEVAFKTGFQDHGYFTQLFRRYMGLTPRQFRTGKD